MCGEEAASVVGELRVDAPDAGVSVGTVRIARRSSLDLYHGPDDHGHRVYGRRIPHRLRDPSLHEVGGLPITIGDQAGAGHPELQSLLLPISMVVQRGDHRSVRAYPDVLRIC